MGYVIVVFVGSHYKLNTTTRCSQYCAAAILHSVVSFPTQAACLQV